MDVKTMRGMTTELSGRTLDATLEANLTQYAVEMAALLRIVRAASQNFPPELAPASVFCLKPEKK